MEDGESCPVHPPGTLMHDVEVLRETLREMGRVVVRELRRTLRIQSPHEVASKPFVEGYTEGWEWMHEAAPPGTRTKE